MINIYFSSKDGRPRAIVQVQINIITDHYCVTNHDVMDDLFSHNQDCYTWTSTEHSAFSVVKLVNNNSVIHFRKCLSELPLNCNVQ